MSDRPMELDPWTSVGAERLLATARALSDAVQEHASRLASLTEMDAQDVFGAGDKLLEAALAYADALTYHTATVYPLGPLYSLIEMIDDEEDEDDPVDDVATRFAVVIRRDYAVTDPTAVLHEGRSAYLHLWPDDGPEEAERDVTHLGRALYQMAHAGGFDVLDRVAGLRKENGFAAFVRTDDVLGSDAEWPGAFELSGELMHWQNDVQPLRRLSESQVAPRVQNGHPNHRSESARSGCFRAVSVPACPSTRRPPPPPSSR